MVAQDRLTPTLIRPAVRSLLRVEGLSVSYGDHEVVREVDLALDAGGSLALIGESGSGKTTTIGKLAAKLTGEGKRVTLAAGDTFRAAATPGYANVTAEMEHFLYTLGVDALFTDNPDKFPRR